MHINYSVEEKILYQSKSLWRLSQSLRHSTGSTCSYEKCQYYLNYALKKVYQSMSTKNIRTAQETKLHLIWDNMSNMIKQAFFRWHQTKATVRS
jgi:hypothetical protein